MISGIIKAIWPTAKHREHEAEAMRLQEASEAEAERHEALIKAEEQALKNYRNHILTVDLTGVSTRRDVPMSSSEILDEVTKRIALAKMANSNDGLHLATHLSEQKLGKIRGTPNKDALYWLLEGGDPDRQWDAAKNLLDGRALVTPYPDLKTYSTAVAETAVRLRDFKAGYLRVSAAVLARSILLRSVDKRWLKSRNGIRQKLSLPPFK